MIKEPELFGSFLGLETHRLIIRQFTDMDAKAVFNYASDPETTKYVSFQTHTAFIDSVRFVMPTIEKYKKGVLAPWAIEWIETHELIGACDFSSWDQINHKAEIGFILSKPYWNKGIMTEVLSRLIQFGFENMELNRIETKCHEDNIASAKVMEKAGMKLDGLLREAFFVKGCYWSMKLYSILRADWSKHPKNTKPSP